jgi:hypothetical protein
MRLTPCTTTATAVVSSISQGNLYGIANEAVKKPVFLAIGNDLGVLTSKVISALGAEGKITAIAGFISVDRETGEFTGHLRDGTTWESKDQPTNTTGEN